MAHRVAVSRITFAVTLTLMSALLFGCGGGLASAQRDYKRGHIPQAKEKLEALERSSTSWPPKKQATYALYRGLTDLAVGDRARAADWLKKAHEWDVSNGGVLVEDDRTRLRLALESLAAPAAPAP